jgi:hypothetical protein
LSAGIIVSGRVASILLRLVGESRQRNIRIKPTLVESGVSARCAMRCTPPELSTQHTIIALDFPILSRAMQLVHWQAISTL